MARTPGSSASEKVVELWLPGAPSDTRSAELAYGPGARPSAVVMQGWHDAPTLRGGDGEIVGTLVDSHDPSRPGQTWDQIERDAVWGSMSGEPISLLAVSDRPGKASWGASSYHERRLRAAVLVVGAHIASLDALKVEGIRATHTRLHLAVSEYGFEVTIWNQNNPDGPGADIKFRAQPPDEWRSRIGIHRLAYGGQLDHNDRLHHKGVSAVPAFEFEPRMATNYLDAWDNSILPFGRLVEFATAGRGGWSEVRARLPGQLSPVGLFHQELAESAQAVEGDEFNDSAVFHLNHLDGRFGDVLRAWHGLLEEYELAIFEGLLASDERFADNRARRYVTALEGLTSLSAIDPVRPMSKTAFKLFNKDLRAIAATHHVPESVLSRLASELRRASLTAQLEALLEDVAASVGAQPDDLQVRIADLVAVRNGLSHTKKGQLRPEIETTVSVARSAEILFQTTVLKQLPTKGKRHLLRRILGVSPS